MKLLFIGAHPADLIDQAGGTIANHINAGDEVWTLAVTVGLFSHPLSDVRMKDEEEIWQVKIRECEEALDFLHVEQENRIWMEAKDGSFFDADHASVMAELARHIRRIRPDVLVSHHPAEGHHPDHAKIGMTVMGASIAAARFIDWDDVLERYQVPNIFFYGYQFHPNMMKLGKNVVPPDVIVDIKAVIEQKANAFMALVSQSNTRRVVWERLNSFEKEWGRDYGFEYAEIFISYQPCRTTLLPDFNGKVYRLY